MALLGATGIGVSDLKRSVAFYQDVLQIGLRPTLRFDVELYTEQLMSFRRGDNPKGSPILLMQYKNAPPPKNQQGKFVFYVEDVKTVVDRCKAHGAEIFLDLGAGDGDAKNIAMVRDPDGFIVEFIPLALLSAPVDWNKQKKASNL